MENLLADIKDIVEPKCPNRSNLSHHPPLSPHLRTISRKLDALKYWPRKVTKSKITADFIVDTLESIWIQLKKTYQANRLVLNLDNGPENNSHRTQFIKRILDFAYGNALHIRLAYYPPYHSKYNPIERI